MTIKELLDRANSGYPDEFLKEYYDDTGCPRKAYGDTLAELIVFEIYDTFDRTASDSDQLWNARQILGNAKKKLQSTIDALKA